MSNSINYFRSFPIKVSTRNEWTLFSELVLCFQLFFFSPRVFAFTYLLGYCGRYLHCQQFIFSLILIFSLIRFSRVRFSVCPCAYLSSCPFTHLSVCPFVCIVLSAFSIFPGPTHRALIKFLKHKKRKKVKKTKMRTEQKNR